MDTRSREEKLAKIMSAGFERAARSLSNLVRGKVKVARCHSVLLQPAKSQLAQAEASGQLYVLVSQIIGDIPGKSFLIFNDNESVFAAMNLWHASDAMRKTILLEVDNLISASVIGELVTSLGLRIYGDAPELHRLPAHELNTFIVAEVGYNGHSNPTFCDATFQFEERDDIQPRFVWNLSNRIFDAIPA